MKKFCSLLICLCLIFSLTATAFASYNVSDYIDEYSAIIPEPVPETYGGFTPEFMFAHDAWVDGLYRYAEECEKAKAQSSAENSPPETTPTPPIESAGFSNVVSSNYDDAPADTGSDDKYPSGSWIDAAGNVYSPDGTLLSPGTTPASVPVTGPGEDDTLLSDIVADPDVTSTPADVDSLLLTDPSEHLVWYVEDLRPADVPTEDMTGLKALVNSIFGEYIPVTTTSIITETVDNDTYQYLVETVAPGAAGVDYEWIAGVVLFAIMLYCLMKLLGGVLK